MKVDTDIAISIDADLQDDPVEIPRFLAEIENGYDLVTGWKENRLDPKEKTIPSKLFNAMTSKMSGLKLNDYNCGFKCYRKVVLEEIDLYGELHRFVPFLAHKKGFKVKEIPVLHHERKHGVSKLPTLLYFKDGKKVGETIGVLTPQELLEASKQNFN